MSEFSEIASEAAALVRKWAGSRECDESVKALIRRAARRLGFTYSRTKALFYREARRIEAHEMDTLRKRVKAEDARNDIAALRRRIDRLERHIALVVEGKASTRAARNGDSAAESG